MTEKIKIAIPKSQLTYHSLFGNVNSSSCLLGHIGKHFTGNYLYPNNCNISNKYIEIFFETNQSKIIAKYDNAFSFIENEIRENLSLIDPLIKERRYEKFQKLSIAQIKELSLPAIEILSPYFDIEIVAG